MIDCVTLATTHLFDGNPLASLHYLRHQSVIERQGWEVPHFKGMEYDTYDNPAATYLVWRDSQGIARGGSRLYPTDRPYMLQEAFSFLAQDGKLPSSLQVWEGSRFCVDKSLPPSLRKRIIQEIVLGYLEFGIDQQIAHYIGVMLPIYWKNIFINSGWKPYWLGEVQKIGNGDRVRAGRVKVSEENLKRVRAATGVHHSVLNYGYAPQAERKIA